MTLEELATMIDTLAKDFRRSSTHWQFTHNGIPMACLIDPNFDRMRIIAAIIDLAEVDEATKDALLEANFHTALDARYGSSNGLLFSAFIHPLTSLDPKLARSALDQVAALVHTYGSHYSSGTLEFVGAEEHAAAPREDEDEGEDEPLLN